MYLEFNFRRGLFYSKVPNYKKTSRHNWGALVPQGDLRSKNTIKQNVLRILLGGVYLMQKHQIHKFVSDSLQTSPFGGPQHIRATSDQKIYRHKRFLEFNFREGLFHAKVPNSKEIFNPVWRNMIDLRLKIGIK